MVLFKSFSVTPAGYLGPSGFLGSIGSPGFLGSVGWTVISPCLTFTVIGVSVDLIVTLEGTLLFGSVVSRTQPAGRLGVTETSWSVLPDIICWLYTWPSVTDSLGTFIVRKPTLIVTLLVEPATAVLLEPGLLVNAIEHYHQLLMEWTNLGDTNCLPSTRSLIS